MYDTYNIYFIISIDQTSFYGSFYGLGHQRRPPVERTPQRRNQKIYFHPDRLNCSVYMRSELDIFHIVLLYTICSCFIGKNIKIGINVIKNNLFLRTVNLKITN